ncbi:MAG: DUF389 domain-containing protein [Flavobacteriales bacterium]|jgi:uncharacterized hydrophobic protein (TIGR00271 family)|tara:strand:- start:285 stop:1733 length:1449 start_codon:yes stop_codon:yes gene_type:complete
MEEEKNDPESESTKKQDDFAEKKEVKDEIKKLPNTIWKYLVSIFSFSNDKDVNPLAVIEDIKKGIEFKGYNVWILICSIFICSIGLNVNSVAVVIGAMLISPLMGPIRGIGLAVGTNNFKLLIYSLINFGVATVVSILASFLYFKLMPFKDETSEILARTEPFILDVLIAFFGGLAGIIAASKQDNSTVVPGVAIATALMPPLCVTGYGLAIGDSGYYLGAFYLFILNSLFICLATIIVLRYLKFPLATYVNKKKERNFKIYIAVFLAVILIPSGMKFKEIFDKSVFNNLAKTFVKEEISEIPGVKIFDEDYNFENETITLFLAGNSIITEIRKQELLEKLSNEKYKMRSPSLVIIQNDEFQNNLTMDDFRLMSKDWENKIMERDQKIKQLESDYKNKTDFTFDLKSANKKLKLVTEFNELETFSASKAYKVNMDGTMDTTLLIVIDWLDSNLIPKRTNKLNEWIEVNFETTNYQVIEKIKK